MKLKDQSTIILKNKTDLDAGYHRLYVMITFALMCITVIDRIDYMLARLPNGSTPVAGEFCIVSKTITDIVQLLLDDMSWNPSELRSPIHQTVPQPSLPTVFEPLNEPPSLSQSR